MNELENLFQSYKKEAFRLEILPFYKVDGEWKDFQHYLKTGELVQDQEFLNYLVQTKIRIDAGANYIRCRVVENPINDYQVFETQLGYIPYAGLGAELYFIERAVYNDLLSSHKQYQLITDFWLFDEKQVAFMNYNSENEWQGFEIGNEHDVAICKEFKSLLIANSYSLEDLLHKEKARFNR